MPLNLEKNKMEKSSPSKKDERKPGSKLSLQKKTRSTKAEKNKVHGAPATISLVDLNETCEFKDGKSLSALSAFRYTKRDPGSDSGASIDETAPATCQVCQKNLSHINTQRQQQHVNRCIDKLEEKEQKEREEKQALDTARTATLDCPMCGQKLNTEQSRKSHLKKCSQQLGVTTEKVLQLVKAQEDERQLMVSAGVIPPAVKSRIKSTDGQKAGKKRTAKEPKSKFDEDVQIAMAISSSIADQDSMARGDLIGQLNQPENSGQEKKKSRKKKNPEEPCQLLALSHADRQKRLADKVNSIFHTEDVYEGSERPKKLFQTKLLSSTGTGHLWNKAVTIEDEERDQFYVKALMPHVQVSGAQTGHNFKRLSSIPGREKSFVGEKVGEQPKKVGPADDIFTASTQTAVVLAELAVDTDDPLSQTLADDLNATGFMIEEDTLALEDDEKQKEREKLGSCMKSLVNNPMYSDIKLVSSDGQKLLAHKIIVATRCPRLIKDDKWREINIPLSSKSALALLNYLYTGELTMTASVQSELIGFCERLSLDDLMDLCQKVKPLNEVDEKVNVKQEDENHVDDIEDLNKTRLNVMLKEIWGESDSESEGSDNENEKIDEGLTEQDYQDIRSSQRHKLEHSEEDGEQTESSDDSAVTDLEENFVHKDVSHVEQESSELAKIGSDGEHKTTSKYTIDAVEMISECDNNDFNSPKEDMEDDYHENTSDDDVLVVDVKQDKSANNGAKHVLNLKRTRQANTGSNKSPRTCVENGDNVVNVDNNHVHNDEKITDSPSSKRIRLSCDTSVKSSVNTEVNTKNAIRTETMSTTDINMDSPVTSFKKLSKEHSKKDLEKSNVAYCGLSFDASFIQTEHSKDDSRSSFDSAPGSASKLDSSATDLFGSPSPRKPLFKSSQKDSPSPKRSLFKPSQKEGISPKKYIFKHSKKETEAVFCIKDNENEPNNATRQIDKSLSQLTYSTDQKDTEVKKIHLSQGSNEFSDDDIEITGYDFMETSQCSAKVEDAKCENRSLTEEASDMMDTTWPENNRDMDDLEITGDNFDQIASQNSPKFEKTKLKHKEDNFANPVMRESKELDDKSTRNLMKNVEMNSSVRKVTENSEDNHVSEINDLESYYDFNESFNESFNDSAIVSYELDVKNTSDNDNLAVENTNSSFCDISNANDKLKDGNAGRNTTSSEVVRIASDSSNSSPETHCSKVTEAKVIETREEAEEITCDIGDTSTVANHAVDNDGNVWDDFEEDYGYADIISSQAEQLENKDSDVDADIDTADDNEADCQSPAVSETQRKITVPLSKENKKASFKTPSVSHGQGKKPWAVPSPFTPMPSYDNMNTPMLKKAVQKFGVKPVGKKRMVKVLKDIYQQTHQYETDSDYEEDSDKNSNTVTMTTVVKAPRNCTVTTTTRVRTVGEGVAMETADSAEVDDFPSSQTDISSSQESDVSDLLEETCIHPPSDDSDVSSSPQKGVDLTKQLTDYIHRNRELKIKMLMYEPIELDVFKKDLKEAGIKCNMDKVMEFLDERCLAFTTKNQRKRPTRGRKKTSKQSNKS